MAFAFLGSIRVATSERSDRVVPWKGLAIIRRGERVHPRSANTFLILLLADDDLSWEMMFFTSGLPGLSGTNVLAI